MTTAVQRLISTKLHPFIHGVQFIGVKQNIQEKSSTRFGIDTKYIRNVCDAKLKDGFQDERLESAGVYLGAARRHNDKRTRSASLGRLSTGSAPSNFSRRESSDSISSAFESPMYVFLHDDEVRLYAWLSPEEADAFGTDAGKRKLLEWLKSFPNEDIIDAAIDANDGIPI